MHYTVLGSISLQFFVVGFPLLTFGMFADGLSSFSWCTCRFMWRCWLLGLWRWTFGGSLVGYGSAVDLSDCLAGNCLFRVQMKMLTFQILFGLSGSLDLILMVVLTGWWFPFSSRLVLGFWLSIHYYSICMLHGQVLTLYYNRKRTLYMGVFIFDVRVNVRGDKTIAVLHILSLHIISTHNGHIMSSCPEFLYI